MGGKWGHIFLGVEQGAQVGFEIIGVNR